MRWRTDIAWFSRLLRHPTGNRGSDLFSDARRPAPARGPSVKNGYTVWVLSMNYSSIHPRMEKEKKPVLYGQPPFLIRTAHTHTCILGAYCVYCPAINSWNLFCKFNLENLIATWWSRRRFPSHFTVKNAKFWTKDNGRSIGYIGVR